jgi:Flp pilus assembly protein TadG
MLSRRKSQGGQTVVLFAFALPVLLGFVGLATDIGYLELTKRLVQTAADAGAVAGAIHLPYGNWTAGAQAATAANGFTNGASTGAGSIVVSVNNPPLTGPHTVANDPVNNMNYVEVIVQAPQPTFFLSAIGITSSTTVTGRAVATSTQGDCIFALASSGAATLDVTLGDINAPKCAIIVDSNNSSALTLSGAYKITASQIGVVGGGLGSGTGWTSNCKNPACTPNPVNVPALPDPLGYLSAPTPATCLVIDHLTVTTTQTVDPTSEQSQHPNHCYDVNVTASGITVTFKPGTYYDITVEGFGPTLVFQTGLYIIVGTTNASGHCIFTTPCSLSLTGVGATMCGAPSTTCHGGTGGVTFYLGSGAASIEVNGIGNYINLAAQTTGPYAGILFYQDRNNSTNACFGGCKTGNTLTGLLNNMQLEGALYFPSAALTFSGCCQNSPGNYYTAYEILVAKTITFFLDIFNDDYSSLGGDSPVRRTLLAE